MPFFKNNKEVATGSADDSVSVAPSQVETLVDDGATQNFTATGRPMPEYKPSAWANMSGGFVANAPQHLPHKFTDDTIMHVSVILSGEDSQPQKRKGSFVNRLKGLGSGNDDRPMKVVKMPRRDYLRYFARDQTYKYIGTEPERAWTAAEVEEKFGQYRNTPPAQWEVNVPSGLQ